MRIARGLIPPLRFCLCRRWCPDRRRIIAAGVFFPMGFASRNAGKGNGFPKWMPPMFGESDEAALVVEEAPAPPAPPPLLLFSIFFALMMAAVAISQSSTLAPDSSKANNAAASIFSILDRKSKIDSSDESGMKLESVKGEIELRHVSFKYPTRPDVQIFRDLNLTIRRGKTIALVGESGSGKSTVVHLLQRFYDPDSREITLNGIEIQRFQLKWLRQQMGLVSQEPVLFNDTIRANIAYGKDGDASEAEIRAGPVQRHDPGLVGNVGLTFTKGDLKEVSEEVAKYKLELGKAQGKKESRRSMSMEYSGFYSLILIFI